MSKAMLKRERRFSSAIDVRQLDDLALVEVLAQRREQLVADSGGRACHRRRVVEHEPLELVEGVAVAVAREASSCSSVMPARRASTSRCRCRTRSAAAPPPSARRAPSGARRRACRWPWRARRGRSRAAAAARARNADRVHVAAELAPRPGAGSRAREAGVTAFARLDTGHRDLLGRGVRVLARRARSPCAPATPAPGSRAASEKKSKKPVQRGWAMPMSTRWLTRAGRTGASLTPAAAPATTAARPPRRGRRRGPRRRSRRRAGSGRCRRRRGRSTV